MSQIKVRYGPSPTGIPHIGNIRTALFNYLFAKNQNGKFYLRIEDTDQNRIVKGAIEKIKESLEVLGLFWDGEFVQSKRLQIYQKYLDVLKSKDMAYEEEGAWRFKINPKEEKISWNDLVHGKVEFPSNIIEDFIIVKSDGFPTYHFASVVDDHEMEITHVMRGDEWISSTPKHIILYEAFGWQHPEFVHLPPILGTDHKKLSKREGAKSVLDYIEEGYLPETIVNFLSLLGWAPKDNREIFSLADLVAEFSIERINKNSPVFNIDKLNWINKQWIKKLETNDLRARIEKFNHKPEIPQIEEILSLVKERMTTLTDFEKLTAMFNYKDPKLEEIAQKIPLGRSALLNISASLEKIQKWNSEQIEETILMEAESKNLKKADILKSIGISVSGSEVTPPLYDALEILGQQITIRRLENASKAIKTQ